MVGGGSHAPDGTAGAGSVPMCGDPAMARRSAHLPVSITPATRPRRDDLVASVAVRPVGAARRSLAGGLVAATALAACAGDGGRTIEDAAWVAAGVDDPEFTISNGGATVVLDVVADTSLPIDDQEDSDFATRAAGITWRTHPDRFDELIVIAAHDGSAVETPLRLTSDELTARWGPRPNGLDDGEGRTAPEAADDGELDDVLAGADRLTTYDATQRELLQPVLRWTAEEHFGVGDVEFDTGEADECLTGVLGDQPTGEFQLRAVASVPAPDALDRFPSLLETWPAAGLDVVTGQFDDGRNVLEADLGDGNRISVTVDGPTLVLRASTGCLDPG